MPTVDLTRPYKSCIYLIRYSQRYYCSYPISCNPYVGCSHDCVYCYAKHMQEVKHQWTPIRLADVDIFRKHFDGAFSGKRNSYLHKLLRKKTPLRFGAMTDPFQPVEKEFEISRQFMEVFSEYDYPVVIATKGTMLTGKKYVDLMKQFPSVVQMTVNFENELLAKQLEPGAPRTYARLDALKKLADEGITTQMRIGPVFPMLNESPLTLINEAKKAGVKDILLDYLEIFTAKRFLENLNNALGYNYITHLQDMNYPIAIRGTTYEADHAHISKVNRALNKLVTNAGMGFYPSIDPNSEICKWSCCCGLDKYKGFDGGLQKSTIKMNGRRVVWHCTWEQYFYGHDCPYKNEVGERTWRAYWDGAGLANAFPSMFVYHPEDNSYSRRDIYEAFQRGEIEEPKLVNGKWVIKTRALCES